MYGGRHPDDDLFQLVFVDSSASRRPVCGCSRRQLVLYLSSVGIVGSSQHFRTSSRQLSCVVVVVKCRPLTDSRRVGVGCMGAYRRHPLGLPLHSTLYVGRVWLFHAWRHPHGFRRASRDRGQWIRITRRSHKSWSTWVNKNDGDITI